MFDEQFLKRFWNKVNKTSPDECWLWTASGNKRGQGQFRVNYNKRQMDTAYRVSWMIKHKTPIPEGMEIMHSCDNPSCVNPAHLSMGTHAQNMRDMVQKGRDKKYSKLSISDVKEIKASKLSQNKLARRFGVTQSTIGRIKLGKTWKHL